MLSEGILLGRRLLPNMHIHITPYALDSLTVFDYIQVPTPSIRSMYPSYAL
jgi:hypothetical protein